MTNLGYKKKEALTLVEKKKELFTKGISQEELAFETGLHRTYISDVERGKRSISLKNIEKIAESLGIEIYELFKE